MQTAFLESLRTDFITDLAANRLDKIKSPVVEHIDIESLNAEQQFALNKLFHSLFLRIVYLHTPLVGIRGILPELILVHK